MMDAFVSICNIILLLFYYCYYLFFILKTRYPVKKLNQGTYSFVYQRMIELKELLAFEKIIKRLR